MSWFIAAILIYMLFQIGGPLLAKLLSSVLNSGASDRILGEEKPQDAASPIEAKKKLVRLLRARAVALGEDRYNAADRYRKPRTVVRKRKSDVKVRARWFK